MMKRFIRHTVVTAAAFSFGCAGNLDPSGDEAIEAEGLGQVDQSLYADDDTSTFWPTHTIPVCWAAATFNNTGFASFRQQLRDQVENTYGRVSDLRFTGWAKCPTNANGRLRITLSTGTGGATDGGYQGSSRVTEMGCGTQPASATVWNPLSVCMHEFGHALGFDHELDRPDAPKPDQCVKPLITIAHPLYFSPYDNDSIMNATYCHERTTLSAWDVVGLHSVYGRKPVGSLVGTNNKCADVDNPSGTQPTGATRVQAWDCLGNANQRWNYDGLHRFQAGGFTYGFLDVQWANSANGTPVWNWTSQPGVAQTWDMTGVQVVGMGDLCLAVPSNNWSNGQALQLATCSATSAAQKWNVKFSGNNTAPVSISGTGTKTGFCVAINGAGQAATLSSCGNAATNVFLPHDRHIASAQNGCLDVQWGNPVPGNPVWGWQCDWSEGAEAQHWKIRGPIHGLAGKCLDLDIAGGAVSGAKLQLWDCNGGANQSWEYHF